MHNAPGQSGGRKNRQPLTGEPYDPGALYAELPDRIATAFPSAGGRGRPSRPSVRTVWRGVMAREALRAGCPATHAFVCDDGRVLVGGKKSRRRWEAAVRALEIAEGLPTPAIPHDSGAFQAVVYAVRRYEAWDASRALAWDFTPGLAWPDGTPASRNFWEVAAEILSLRQDVDDAIAAATGKQPPDSAIRERQLRTLERKAELDRLIREQREDERRDRSRRVLMPGSGRNSGAGLHDW